MSSSANSGSRGGPHGGLKKKIGLQRQTEGGSPDLRSLSVLVLVIFALNVIFMKWFLEDRNSGFLPGQASPRTYFALLPLKYATAPFEAANRLLPTMAIRNTLR